MNHRLSAIVAAAALTLMAGAASAQEATPATWANEQTPSAGASATTREAVRAEIVAARQAGQLNPFDTDVAARAPINGAPTALAQAPSAKPVAAAPKAATASTGLTRAEVRAELEAARRSGELNEFDNLAYLAAPSQSVREVPRALAQAPR